jgi:large subunit ribosomal protein L4
VTTATDKSTNTDSTQPVTGDALVLEVRTAGLTADRQVSLPGEVFDARVSIPLIHQVVVAQLAAARQGTHKTKTRGEVRGGGVKPYRQKGTGRARQGSIRAPQFAGGGVVHGPVPRDYSQRTPKKMKAAALRGALSDRARNGRIHVVDKVVIDAAPSTKQAVRLLSDITTRPHVLVVAERTDTLTWKSLRNAPTVHLIAPGQLNTYDVLVSDDIVFTEGALQAFLAGSPKGKSAKATAIFAGDLPGSSSSSAGTATKGVAGDAAGDVDQGGTPGEDLDTHHLDSDVPSIAPSAANEEGSK